MRDPRPRRRQSLGLGTRRVCGSAAIRGPALWDALPGQQLEREAHRRRLGVPLELQRDVEALAWSEDAVGEEQAEVRVAHARPAAGVEHLDVEREASSDYEEVRVDRRCTAVRDPVDPALVAGPFPLSAALV